MLLLLLITFLANVFLLESRSFFNQTYVYLNSSFLPSINGFYVKVNQSLYGANTLTRDCGTVTGSWPGSLAYRRSPNGTFYLYEVYVGTSASQFSYLAIGSDMCSTSSGLIASTSLLASQTTEDWITLGNANKFQLSNSSSFNISFYSSSSVNTPSPTKAPTNSPTTGTPTTTKSPTGAPTPKPTSLTSNPETVYDNTVCTGLTVTSLNQAFSNAKSTENFYVTTYYKGRRVWYNGKGIYIYFSTRYHSTPGDWIISNGSYVLLGNGTGNNSDVPGISAAIYDHFPLNNIYFPLLNTSGYTSAGYTIVFACSNTVAPSSTPTGAPTTLVTPSPTIACAGLYINIGPSDCSSSITDFFTGPYQKQSNNFNGYPYWKGVITRTGDFLYHSAIFNAWVLDSSRTTYSALLFANSTYPSNGSNWTVSYQSNVYNPSCYVRFDYTCSVSNFPTLQPTSTPTTPSPTAPIPVASPTGSPTISPTRSPTTSPTRSPTHSPTLSPTKACEGIVLSGASSFDGNYTKYNDTNIGSKSYYWRRITGDQQIFYSSTTYFEAWVIQSYTLNAYWLSNDIPDTRPPSNGTWEYYSGASPFLESTKYLSIECSVNGYYTPAPTQSPTNSPTFSPTSQPTPAPTLQPTSHPTESPTTNPTLSPISSPTNSPTQHPTTTKSPTFSPTSSPSLSPTISPTSPCFGLHVTPNTFVYAGWYNRQSTLINDHYWWKGIDVEASVRYVNGHWYIVNSDANSDISDVFASDSSITNPYFPLNGTWYYERSDDAVDIIIGCDDTFGPTPSPTPLPTNSYGPPIFSYCEQAFFALVVQNQTSTKVEWIPPVAYDEDGSFEMVSTSNYTSGDYFTPGEYNITYTATDIYNLSSTCVVTLYVLGNSAQDSYDRCFSDKFAVILTFNGSDLIAGDTVTYSDASVISGRIYISEFDQGSIVCLVRGTKIVQAGSEEFAAATTTKWTFLGVAMSDIAWEIIILLVTICIIGLILDSIRVWYQNRKENNIKKKVELIHIANEHADPDGVVAGVASEEVIRKATLTHNVAFSPKQTVSAVSPIDPDLEDSLDDKPPGLTIGGSNPNFWKSELDRLNKLGYTNEEKNLRMLDDYSIRNNDGTINKETTFTKIQGLLSKEKINDDDHLVLDENDEAVENNGTSLPPPLLSELPPIPPPFSSGLPPIPPPFSSGLPPSNEGNNGYDAIEMEVQPVNNDNYVKGGLLDDDDDGLYNN